MATIAGDVKEWAVDHPELGGRILECKSAEDATIKKGGFVNRDDDADISSQGNKIYVKNMKAWGMETTIVAKSGDLDFIQSLHESTLEAVWTATFMDGTFRAGNGAPCGDNEENKQAGTIALKVDGSGLFEEI